MMTINDQIKDEKLQYNINREISERYLQRKYLLYHQVNYTNMNILLAKMYYHLPNNK